MKVPALWKKRKQQDPADRHIGRILIRRYSDRYRILWDTKNDSTVEVVPPREKARPVAVRLVQPVGVMDPMHPRRHDEPHQPALPCDRQLDVRMMEEDRREEDRLPRPNRERRRADDDDL